MRDYPGFDLHHLDEDHVLWQGALPRRLVSDEELFEEIWNLHPKAYHSIVMHGKRVDTPRWQQAFLRDYAYTGSRNLAQPLPGLLEDFLDWSRKNIDEHLNGLLLNWYDGARGHYMGKHRDRAGELETGAPIVTISLGESRLFRLRPWKGQGMIDFEALHGSVFILPYATNQAWTHEVPHFRKNQGRRISITLRVFRDS